MADSDAPPPAAGGGPGWRQGSSAAGSSPSSVLASTPQPDGRGGPSSAEALSTARFNRTGVTPVPYAVVALAGLVATWWGVRWAQLTPDAPEPVEVSEWWFNVFAVLMPGEDVGVGAYSTQRLWIATGIAVAAAVACLAWIGRIGKNVRPGSLPFGTVMPLLAFPAWWMLPVTMGLADGSRSSRSDLIVRFLVGFAILFAQFLLARWPLLNRIWRAGLLPYDIASIVLWLPNLIPWSMLFLSSAYTVFVIDDGGGGSSSWMPTQAMEDWAVWTTRLSALGLLVLLLVVTGAQHLGMRQDHLDDEASRAR